MAFVKRNLPLIIANTVLLVLVLVWILPSIGLIVSSFRSPFETNSSGWWNIVPHREYVAVEDESVNVRDVCENQDCTLEGPITFEGVTATLEEWRAGIELDDGRFAVWLGSLRVGRIEFQERQWVFPRLFWTTVDEISPADVCPRAGCVEDEPIEIGANDIVATYEGWQEGQKLVIGRRAIWEGGIDDGTILIQERDLSFDLYIETILGISRQTIVTDLTTGESISVEVRDQPLYENFLNSLAVTLPATIIPIMIAAMAAYAFAWMRFRGRQSVFIVLIMLLVIPIQIALVPLLSDFAGLGINGTFLAVWIAHTAFGLPTATYLLYNYISQLPREILESAHVDGASHFVIFARIVLPLAVPAIVSFMIFQFLWVWNDYLVARVFLGNEAEVLTQQLVNFQGSVGTANDRGNLLPAAAFISFIVPLVVFLALQRYFVRGLLAGSVKG